VSASTDGKATRDLVLARIREDERFLLVTHEHPDVTRSAR
jgi:nanoRNase/pAp phosphatase (c-di-AMP/oligoRNAs hydrolase)